MDAGLLRGLYTVFMFAAFIGVVWWAWSARRNSDFEEAANLPLESDLDSDGPATNGTGSGRDHEGAEQS